MTYPNIHPATFLHRPNRFIAQVRINGVLETCHVKNTGRCRELLVPGATVYLQEVLLPHRKTHYDLICVEKGDRLINMDSQVPNKVFAEWALESGYFPAPVTLRPETFYGHSRFDFHMEADEKKWFVEVKGVTLEQDRIARFPDAPTERGVKHLHALMDCRKEGYEALMVFLIQTKGIDGFMPNDETHSAFGQSLREAAAQGVQLLALDCHVTPDTIQAADFVPIYL